MLGGRQIAQFLYYVLKLRIYCEIFPCDFPQHEATNLFTTIACKQICIIQSKTDCGFWLSELINMNSYLYI